MQSTLIAFLILWVAVLSSQAPPPADKENAPPNPVELKEGWNSYFEERGTLESRSQQFSTFLQDLLQKAKPEEKEHLAAYNRKIRLTLNLLIKAQSRPAPLLPKDKTFEGSYSISKLIDVYRNLRLKTDEINTLQEEIKDKTVLLQAAQEAFDKTRQDYDKADDLSENKLILGLQLILDYLEWSLIKNEVTYLRDSLHFQEANQNQIDEELNYALQHLITTQEEVEQFKAETLTARDEWLRYEEVLKNKESISSQTSISQNRPNSSSSQEVTKASILEAFAHQHFIFKLEELNLAQLLYNREDLDLNSLNKDVASWGHQLERFTIQSRSWSSAIQKQLQRSLQTLSLIKSSDIFQEATPTTVTQEQALNDIQSTLLLLQQLDHENDEARFLLKELNRQLSGLIGGKTKWLWDIRESIQGLFTALFNWMSQTLFVINNTSITPFSILRFLLIFLAAIWLSRFVLRLLSAMAQTHRAIEKSMMYRINRLIYYFILAIGLIIAMSSIGFDFSSFVLIASALGVGLGFGLQAIFNNFISGIILLFESQVKVGDFIELESGAQGEIREIHVRNTLLKTQDGADILVPNSQLISTRVTNWTLTDPYRRIHIPFSIPYNLDKDKVSEIAIDAAKKVPFTVTGFGKPAPMVYITKLGESRIEMDVVVWVSQKAGPYNRYTFSDYLWAIDTAFKENGIEIQNPPPP